MKCSNCGHDNVEGSRYCNQCAFPLTSKNVTLGGYSIDQKKFINSQKKGADPHYITDESIPFYERKNRTEEQVIYDPDLDEIRPKKSVVLKMTLVVLLALFVFVAYNAVKFAVDTQQERIAQAEIAKQQKALAEELKQLENYREKFNSVVESYENQSVLIEENIQHLTKLRVNRFMKGLGLGDVFNGIVNKVLDVSDVYELKERSATLNVLVEELTLPPETYLSKYETLGRLKTVENSISHMISGDITAQTKEDLIDLHEEYKRLLVDIKR